MSINIICKYKGNGTLVQLRSSNFIILATISPDDIWIDDGNFKKSDILIHFKAFFTSESIPN
jgi:hypothetical protein